MMVKLEEVVMKISGNEDRFTTDLEYYLAGEHYESERIAIYKKGIIKDNLGVLGFKFHFPFKAGDTIFMSRNPHLKKAGMVTYDGICSDTSYILRTRDNNILNERFLPLVLQNDRFWRWFEENKSGSVNYLLNWKSLKEYEFDLPPIEEQLRIADIAWAVEETRVAYERMIAATDDLVKSQFIEIFGNPNTDCKYPVTELGNICDMISGGTPSSKHPEYFGGNIPFISTPSLGPNYIDASAAQNWLTEEGVKNSATHRISAYAILFGNRVGVGKSSINTCEVCTNQDILSFINIDPDCFDLLFIKKVLDQYQDYFDSQKRGATIKGIPSDLVKASKIPVAPLDVQHAFVDFVRQSDKSKFMVQLCSNLNLSSALVPQEQTLMDGGLPP